MSRPDRFVLWEDKLIKDSFEGNFIWSGNAWEIWGGSVWREEGEGILPEAADWLTSLPAETFKSVMLELDKAPRSAEVLAKLMSRSQASE